MMLSTKTKIEITSYCSRVVVFLNGSENRKVIVKRRGIKWALDLTEAIDFMIYLLGSFEIRTISEYRKVIGKDSVVVDIGANVGAHTLHFARMVRPSGRVFAFEPTCFAYEKLKKNISLNPELIERIVPNQMFLCREASDADCPRTGASWPLSNNEQAHPLACFIEKSSDGARRESLDNYFENNPIERLDLIKLDVDGHELDVLQGSLATIRRFQPKIKFELAPYILKECGVSSEELLAFFDDMKYSISRTSQGKEIPNGDRQKLVELPDGSSINLWAIPKK